MPSTKPPYWPCLGEALLKGTARKTKINKAMGGESRHWTSALDSKSESKINEALSNISKTKTVIVIAHRLSTIKNVDKILFFKNGEIIEKGSHNELYNMNGEYTKLYNIQFGKK